MPLNISGSTPAKFPSPQYLTLDTFKRGVISLIDKSRLPKDALDEADNLFLVEDGQPSVRPGVGWFGATTPRTLSSTDTNLVANPGLEAAGTGWSAYQALGTRSIVTAYQGSHAWKVFVTAITPDSPVGIYAATGLTNGLTYTFSAYVKAPAGRTIFCQSGQIAGSYAQVTATGGWDLVTSPPGVVTGTTANLEFGLANATAQINDVFYIDAAILTQSAAAIPYFDGETTDLTLIDYDWTGTQYLSTSTRKIYTAAAIDGFDYFDFAGVIHLVIAAGGVVSRSTDDGATWTACTGATPTAGVTMNMLQNGGYMYLTNGTDNIIRYDGSTTLATYTVLTTPAAPTVAETGLAGTGYSYYYKVSAVNTVGFSTASAASTVVQSSVARETWDATTNYATITVPAFQATQTRADIYLSDNNVDFFYLTSTTLSGATYKDDGTAIPIPSTSAPTANTTQGPKVAELVNVGSRMYGVRDTDNPYRVWFSGAGTYAGAFSGAYDGGYLNWQTGGKYRPVKVEDYRDGKGTPLATIWCKSADGQGCILQMSPDTLTVGDISITVLSAYKLPGSRGTPAPGSVVNVLNDYMFYNSQAFYNLGSRAQFLNLLSTDEASANIRPTVKQISTTGEANIASVYYDAKVYFSVPYGSTTNNYTAIFDTERKAWLPTAFTLGFKKFLRYTTTAGISKLLALKPGDTRLSEISSGIQGDYGVAFSTSLLTGLYPTTKNRFEFQFTEEGEVEFSNPQGTISVELLGIERSRGFSTANTESVTIASSTTGWDAYLWDSRLWDDADDVVAPFSESSVKRYFTVQKELNAVQWHITTSSLDSHYVLRTLQSWGTDTNAGKPRPWRL